MLSSGLELLGQVLWLQREPFESLLGSTRGLRWSLLVVFFAGLSQALGQSVVLFANRVRPHRFVASLILNAALYLLGFALLVSSIWLVARYGFGRHASLGAVMRLVGVAYAPYLFSFFILTPYFGSFITVALSLWSLAAVLVALEVVFGLSLAQAFLCSALGWLLLQLTQRSLGRPLQRAVDAGRSLVAGRRLALQHEQLEDLVHRARREDDRGR